MNGNSNQEITINEKKRSFDEYLEVSPNIHKVVVGNNSYLVSIQDVKFHDIEYPEDKYMITQSDCIISVGDLVKWDDEVWLVRTKKRETIKSKQSYRMTRTNHNLKFINENNELIIKPCIVSAKTLYNPGIKDEKIIEIPNGMVGIILPHDSDTELLDRKHAFVFNKTKYEITFFNETEFKGLLILICSEANISHLDDTVNEIADRWVEINGEKVDRLPWLDEQEPPEEPGDPEEPIEGISYTLIIETPYAGDDPDVLYYGETYNYIVTKLVDGVEVAGSFTFELSSEEHATITGTTSNSCEVTAKMFFMTQSVTLTITDIETDEVAIEKEIILQGM